MIDFSSMLNNKLSSIAQEMTSSGERILFRFVDGSARIFGVAADCCSESWIEHLEQPDNIEGAIILSVVDSGTVDEFNIENTKSGNSCINVYQTIFRTDRGDITLEYRNASNGMYGGYLVDIHDSKNLKIA